MYIHIYKGERERERVGERNRLYAKGGRQGGREIRIHRGRGRKREREKQRKKERKKKEGYGD